MLVAAVVTVFATGIIQIGGDERTHEAARNFALSYLANPNQQTISVSNEHKLLIPCPEPRIEDEVVVHAKLRYDFKVTCANNEVGYVTVLLRGSASPIIGVSIQSPVLTNRK